MPVASLSPLGVGSADAESLSSYAQRVAAHEGVLPGQLVFRVLTWLDEGLPQMVGRWANHPRRVRIGHNNNGYSHAHVWLGLLQRLTGRADLEQLTTAAWDHNFPTRHFQRAELAVCPLCLSEDQLPYHRLAWLLQAVKVCLHHRVALLTTCQNCHRSIPVIHDRSTILNCPWCAGDLRRFDQQVASPYPAEYDMWAAEEVGQIIKASSNWMRPVTWDPGTSMKALREDAGLRDAAAFARFVGVSKSTASYWFSARVKPTLPIALYTFHRFGRSLANQLSPGWPSSKKTTATQPEFRLRPVRTRTPRDWAHIRRLLVQESKCPPDRTRSVAQFSKSIHVDERTLRLRMSDLCRTISQRHVSRLTSERTRVKQILRNQILGAIGELRREGLSITRRNVAVTLKRPDFFRRRNARAVFDRLAADCFHKIS